MNANQVFLDRLEELCNEKGITKRQLEKEAGLAIGSTSKWKTGLNPNHTSLRKISSYFMVDSSYLLGESDYRNADHLLTSGGAKDIDLVRPWFESVGIPIEMDTGDSQPGIYFSFVYKNVTYSYYETEFATICNSLVERYKHGQDLVVKEYLKSLRQESEEILQPDEAEILELYRQCDTKGKFQIIYTCKEEFNKMQKTEVDDETT